MVCAVLLLILCSQVSSGSIQRGGRMSKEKQCCGNCGWWLDLNDRYHWGECRFEPMPSCILEDERYAQSSQGEGCKCWKPKDEENDEEKPEYDN